MATYAPADRIIRQIKEEAAKKNPSHENIKQLIEDYFIKLTSQVNPAVINAAVASAIRTVICLSNPWNQFEKEVSKYDYAIKCSKVWNTDYYGYRCRTCNLSPCMSLCGPCFQNGNHEGHDFNRFRSQSGGACDCGDPNVLKPMGFCQNHGIENVFNKPSPPDSLLLSARHTVPHLFAHLAHRFRTSEWPPLDRFSNARVKSCLKESAPLLELLTQLGNLGAAMQKVLREALLDRDIYAHLMGGETFAAAGSLQKSTSKPFGSLLDTWISTTGWLKEEEMTREADDLDFSCLREVFTARHFLDEFIFWILRFRFPDQLGHCFLGLLTEDNFRTQFAEAFSSLYPAMVKLLEAEAAAMPNDTVGFSALHNRFVHISVQLLSGAALAVHLVQNFGIFEKLLSCVFYLLCRASNGAGIDMNNPLLLLNSTWPFMSDLQNLLSHSASMDWLLSHENTLRLLLRITSRLQAMNMNNLMVREHVEYELESHYTSFNLENELVAFMGHAYWSYPSWKTESVHRFLLIVAKELSSYFARKHNFPVACTPMATKAPYSSVRAMAFSYHIPLQRLFACIMAIGTLRGLTDLASLTKHVLEPAGLTWVQLLHQPLRVMTAYGETRADIWRRNGFTMSAQAFMYTNHMFNLHFVEHDIFMVQACASQVSPNRFVCDLLHRFHLHTTRLLLIRGQLAPPPDHLPEEKVEGLARYALLTISWILCQRTYCGLTMDEVARKNMVSALAVNERSHSDVRSYLPDRGGSGNCHFSTTVEELMTAVLDQIATLRPACIEEHSGRLRPALYGPSEELWTNEFDPLYLQLQHQSRGQNLQAAMNNYSKFLRQRNAWPPYRLPPQPLPPSMRPLDAITQSRVLHAYILLVLKRYLDAEAQPARTPLVTERTLALAVFLLDLAVCNSERDLQRSKPRTPPQDSEWVASDGFLYSYYPCDDILTNLCHRIAYVRLSLFEASDAIPYDILTEPTLEGRPEHDEFETSMEWATVELDCTQSMPGWRSSTASYTTAPNSSTTSGSFVTASSGSGSDVSRRFVVGSEDTTPKAPPPPPPGLETMVRLDESLLTLLLKVHGALSPEDGAGVTPQVFDRRSHQVLPEQACDHGDGAFYVQRLLRRAARLSGHVVKELRALLGEGDPQEGGVLGAEANKKDKSGEDEEEGAAGAEVRRKKRQAVERKERMLRKMQKNADKFKKNNRVLMDEAERMDMAGAAETPDAPAVETCFICGLHTPTMYFPAYIQVTKVPVASHRRPPDEATAFFPTSSPSSSPTSSRLSSRAPAEAADAAETRWDVFAVSVRGWLDEARDAAASGHLPRPFPMQALATRVCMHVVCHRCREDMRWTKYPTPPDLCSLCRQVINHFIPCFDRSGQVQAGDAFTAPHTVRLAPTDVDPCVAASTASLLGRTASLKSAALSHGHLEELSRRWWEWLHSAQVEAVEELQSMGAPARATLEDSSLSASLGVAVVRTQLELEVAAAQSGNQQRIRAMRQKFHWEAVMRYLEVMSAVSERSRSEIWQRTTALFEFPELSDGANLNTHMKIFPCPILLLEPEDCFVSAIAVAGKDKTQFRFALRACLNLAYLQALVSTVLQFRSEERRAWCCKTDRTSDTARQRLSHHLTAVYRWLKPCLHWLRNEGPRSGRVAISGVDCEAMDVDSDGLCCQEVVSPYSVEARLQTCLLPLLRLALAAQARWWPDDDANTECLQPLLPRSNADVSDEFSTLVSALGLDLSCLETCANLLVLRKDVTIDKALSNLRQDISVRDPTQRIWNYLEDVLRTARILWLPPCLLRLPHEYDDIFLPSQQRICSNCLQTPKESAICLICGDLVCFRQRCCRGKVGNYEHLDECAVHAQRCGRGTCLFLLIRTCSVLVLHNLRMFQWGTLYLDNYGDEDLSMQRGRPLFLNEQRFHLLESQWLTHSLPFLPGRQWNDVTRLSFT